MTVFSSLSRWLGCTDLSGPVDGVAVFYRCRRAWNFAPHTTQLTSVIDLQPVREQITPRGWTPRRSLAITGFRDPTLTNDKLQY